ncbi:hypothetical protein EIN_134420 [Entamoeba invadens IP1]|uniref:SH3 domain-containing protein n=1 Tax=Entamoeba invadens IP1 TaxID=370355 RepID=A0A0A1TX97_ENTIV|nr:hypothetical protein EIN_134420 [Entamoeba invadens IP1]ELP85898.1 hypothetical protein EIN_134420 [Entamoeba invadens IP1]|eukprot:XP_004185244.1 hypothetical protein EIN_134420 [Entamoeba invadens IP1]
MTEKYDVPLLRGYLTRQETSGTKGWNKRWFQNSYEHPLILECYQSEKSTKPLLVIDFKDVSDLKTLRTKADDSDKKRYGFQFKYGKHSQKLLTDGEDEGEYWREGFSSLLKVASGKALEHKVEKPKEDVDPQGLYPGEYFATTLVDFCSSESGIMSFKKGEAVIVVGQPENGWVPIEFGGKRGWAPAEFITKVAPNNVRN